MDPEGLISSSYSLVPKILHWVKRDWVGAQACGIDG